MTVLAAGLAVTRVKVTLPHDDSMTFTGRELVVTSGQCQMAKIMTCLSSPSSVGNSDPGCACHSRPG